MDTLEALVAGFIVAALTYVLLNFDRFYLGFRRCWTTKKQEHTESDTSLLETILSSVQAIRHQGSEMDKRLKHVEELLMQAHHPVSSPLGTRERVDRDREPSPSSQETSGSREFSLRDILLEAMERSSGRFGSLVRQEIGNLVELIRHLHSNLTEHISNVKTDLTSQQEMGRLNVGELTRQLHSDLKELISNAMAALTTQLQHSNSILVDPLNNNMQALTQAANQQRSTLNDIKSELGKNGTINSMLRVMHSDVLDEIVTQRIITCQVVRSYTKDKDDLLVMIRLFARGRQPLIIGHFHVTNWNRWEQSGEPQRSRAWCSADGNINVRGRVVRSPDGQTMDIWLVQGLSPRVSGLIVDSRERCLKVNVTAMRQSGQGDNWQFGSKTGNLCEARIPITSDSLRNPFGFKVVSDVSLLELQVRGMVADDKVVLQFEIWYA